MYNLDRLAASFRESRSAWLEEQAKRIASGDTTRYAWESPTTHLWDWLRSQGVPDRDILEMTRSIKDRLGPDWG